MLQKLKAYYNMHQLSSLFILVVVFWNFSLCAQNELDDYMLNFDYESRKEMKLTSAEITQLLVDGEAILVDIRFEEEQQAWGMPFALKMPLPNLPNQYTKLPKDQLIVTACPHKDRAIIAMLFLKSKGYNAAYLKHGLLDLATYLRGDQAADFIKKLNNE